MDYTKQQHAENLVEFFVNSQDYDLVGDDVMLCDYHRFFDDVYYFDLADIYEEIVYDEEFVNYFTYAMAKYVKIDDDQNLCYELSFFKDNDRDYNDFIRFNRLE